MITKPCLIMVFSIIQSVEQGEAMSVEIVIELDNSIAYCKSSIIPVRKQWNYVSFAWSHRFIVTSSLTRRDVLWNTLIARFVGQHGAHLGPRGPRWAPCSPHELCYLGIYGLGPEQNGRHFAGYIFKCIFLTRIFVFFEFKFLRSCSQGSNQQ